MHQVDLLPHTAAIKIGQQLVACKLTSIVYRLVLQVRAQLNALSAAHEARSSQQAASATAHTLTLGILGVGAALEAGAPLSPALRSLTAAVRAAQGGPEELGTGAGGE
jgi:hypothetical protein